MRIIAHRRTAALVAGLATVTLVAAGCSSDNNDDDNAASASVSSAVTEATSAVASSAAESGDKIELTGANGETVTLTGAIAAKYAAATEEQKKDLGKPLTDDDASGTSDNGVIFQQFDGGVITAKNADSPAFITWGKIRDAWNVERDAEGKPSDDGEDGSEGPLGAATSDETTEGDIKKSTFENGEITFNSATNEVIVTVKGQVVPTQ